jgi:hypothetical protein
MFHHDRHFSWLLLCVAIACALSALACGNITAVGDAKIAPVGDGLDGGADLDAELDRRPELEATPPADAALEVLADAGLERPGPADAGVSSDPCPAAYSVVRGCSAPVGGAPCDVCRDAAGAGLRCAVGGGSPAGVWCVTDCAQCR